jgi:putative heme iron utilization protein
MTAIASTGQRVADYLAERPNAMTAQAARDLGLPEADVIRHLPGDNTVELDVARFEEILTRCAAVKSVHVIVSNRGATLEATGQLGGFSRWGEFFNVQTKGIDMHVRLPHLRSAFSVKKPSHMDGVSTLSVQFYDDKGDSAFKVFFTFGQKAAAPAVQTVWDDIRRDFAR